MGKVGALRKAGWSIRKIAEDMHVDPATIANRLREEAAKNEGDGHKGESEENHSPETSAAPEGTEGVRGEDA